MNEDKVKTPREIILDAFHEIQDKHGVALVKVEFQLYDSSTYSKMSYIPMDIDIEGKLL